MTFTLEYQQQQSPGQQMLDRTYEFESVLLLNEYQEIVLALLVEELEEYDMDDKLEAIALQYLPNFVEKIVSKRPGRFKSFVNKNRRHFTSCLKAYLARVEQPTTCDILYDRIKSTELREHKRPIKWTSKKLQEIAAYQQQYVDEYGHKRGYLPYVTEMYNKNHPDDQLTQRTIQLIIHTKLEKLKMEEYTSYDSKLCTKLLRLAKNAYDMAYIKRNLGVSNESIQRYKKKYPEFKEAWDKATEIKKDNVKRRRLLKLRQDYEAKKHGL